MRIPIVITALLILFGSTSAWAQQPAPTLASLPSQVDVGDDIQVVAANGTTINGRFEGVTNTSLRLTVDGMSRELLDSTIRQVKLRRADPKWNGTLIGGGIGALAAILVTSGKDDPEQVFYERAAFIPLFTGIGLGVGALVDFAIKRYDTVFQVSPVASRERLGLSVRIVF